MLRPIFTCEQDIAMPGAARPSSVFASVPSKSPPEQLRPPPTFAQFKLTAPTARESQRLTSRPTPTPSSESAFSSGLQELKDVDVQSRLHSIFAPARSTTPFVRK